MTEMLDFGWSERPYWDRKNWSSLEAYKGALKTSSTLYVGNLSFYTQESQIYALFDQVRWMEGLIVSAAGVHHPFHTTNGLCIRACMIAERRMSSATHLFN